MTCGRYDRFCMVMDKKGLGPMTWSWLLGCPPPPLTVPFSSLCHNTDCWMLLVKRKFLLFHWPSLEMSMSTHVGEREKCSNRTHACSLLEQEEPWTKAQSCWAWVYSTVIRKSRHSRSVTFINQWMRSRRFVNQVESSWVIEGSAIQCQSRNSSGFNSRILRHFGMRAPDETHW
jgi:hypothetical protein